MNDYISAPEYSTDISLALAFMYEAHTAIVAILWESLCPFCTASNAKIHRNTPTHWSSDTILEMIRGEIPVSVLTCQ